MNSKSLQPGLNELDLSNNGTFMVYVKDNNNFKILDKVEEGKNLYDIESRIDKRIEESGSRYNDNEIYSTYARNRKSKEGNVKLSNINKEQDNRKTNDISKSKSNSTQIELDNSYFSLQ